MKKRLLSMILAISMVLTFLPVSAITAFAANGDTIMTGKSNYDYRDDVTYTLIQNNDDSENLTYTLKIEGTGRMAYYSGSNVAPWYSFASQITSIEIGDNVTFIGDYAFRDCSNLTNIEIPNSVKSIEGGAFLDCSSLTSIKLPDSIKSIEGSVFRGCSSLTSINLPDNVTSISDRVFEGCNSLTTITFSKNVTYIGDKAFYGCTALKNITIPDKVTQIGEYAFYNCSSLSEITVPASVTRLKECAFQKCSGLKSVTLLANITSIERYTFAFCSNLKSITISDSVASIGDYAFYQSGLKTVTVPDKVTSIGSYAFSECSSLISASVPSKVTKIGSYVFIGCDKLESVTIGGAAAGYGAFWGCSNLKSVIITSNATAIGKYTFYECSNLESVTIPNTVTTIGSQAFYKCSSLSNISIPASVTSIDSSAFVGCSSLPSITIPTNITTISSSTFSGCRTLTSVTIPANVTTIESDAFSGCSNLTEVILPQNVPSIGENAFRYDYNLKIYYPYSKAEWEAQPNVTNNQITNLASDGVTLVYSHSVDQTPPRVPICYLLDVTFDANGGTLASTTPTEPVKVYRTEYVTNTKANELTSIDAPTRTGYTFAGWYTSATPQEGDTAFDLATTAVQDDMTLYADWTAKGCTIKVPENCTVKDADTNQNIPVDADHNADVKYDQKITITAPALGDGDVYEWGNGGNTVSDNNSNEYTFTVAGNTEIKLSTLKALHITDKGEPKTDGTKHVDDTYYGNGWEYSANDVLTIKETKDLTDEPAVKVAVKVEDGVTVSNAKLTKDVTNNGTISNARLTGDVTNNGTLSNCVLDKAPTGTGNVENSLFGAEYTGAKTLTEADGNEITAALKGVKDGSLTDTKLWFVGTPELTATVKNTEIKHINHDDVTKTTIDGVKGTVETDNADNSVTFTPNGEKDILLNNRTAESGDFTFDPEPTNCTYDGDDHGVDTKDITYNNTTDVNTIASVKYEYKKPGWKDGDTTDEVTEAKNAGTYTVKIVMSDGQTIDTGKSFTISPAKPGENDFEFVKKLPSGVTEDRDDSEKTAEVQLKSDSLFNADNSNVTTKYQKKNAAGEWEDVTAPSGKGEYKLVATVTPKDTTNLTGGTVEWEFTILDREDASWLTMSVEDGKITKVTRPAADDAEEDITEKVLLTASADGSKTAYKVPAGAQVTVTANDAPQDMKFEMWRFSVNSMNGDTTLALYSRSMTFTLKDDFAGLTVSAMYQDAAIDSGYDILGPAAAATTAVVGSAILAYQGHMLGTELYLIYLLPSGAVIPANRIQLAMLLWQDAGNPAPVDETPYSDIDSGDTDAMQAAQWAVETGLMELPDADNAPDQFDPYAAVSNVDVIHAWKKAQKVKG